MWSAGGHPHARSQLLRRQSEHVTGHHLAKVVVVMADGRPVELIVPASRRVVLERVRTLLCPLARSVWHPRPKWNDSLSIARPVRCTSPSRRWKDVDVLMDASMPRTGELVFQAGTHEDAIGLAVEDWLPLVESYTEF